MSVSHEICRRLPALPNFLALRTDDLASMNKLKAFERMPYSPIYSNGHETGAGNFGENNGRSNEVLIFQSPKPITYVLPEIARGTPLSQILQTMKSQNV